MNSEYGPNTKYMISLFVTDTHTQTHIVAFESSNLLDHESENTLKDNFLIKTLF